MSPIATEGDRLSAAASQRSPSPAALGDFAALDLAYGRYFDQHQEMGDRWLLAQTLATGPSRRVIMPLLGVSPGERIVDLGTGFGPLALELAATYGCHVTGTDNEADKLEVARAITEDVSASGWLADPASVAWEVADTVDLPMAASSIDRVVGRLILQHVTDPVATVAEAARVLRPGGRLCVVDVDDQLTFSWPLPSPAQAFLEDALRQAQAWRGGDRFIGRKLPALMAQAGLEVELSVIVPQAGYGEELELARAFNVSHFARSRESVLAARVTDAATFDRALDDYACEPLERQFSATGQMLVVGRKPE
ncbi:MAG: methyltransferase domain-containing protein [Actinomycetota bacterium]|nr:methyltransferase domain-containing protein [Actinomycetota bacterium]